MKPRLLGHWSTSPGLNLIDLRPPEPLIREHAVNAIYLAGPAHAGLAVLANLYLEGTYTDVYPEITRDAAGMVRAFRQFGSSPP